MEHLMREIDVVNDLMTFHITRLFMRNQKRNDEFETISNDFGYDLVNNIIQSYG